MLRITRLESPKGDTMKLEGRLAGAAVNELARVVGESLNRAPRLELDLVAVSFVDAEGVALLHALVDRRVEIRRTSAFVSELLRNPG